MAQIAFCTINAQEKAIPAKWEGFTPGNIFYTQGNVGIGTTTPSQKFEVVGSSLFQGSVTGNHFKTKYESINEGAALYQLNNQEDRIRWGIGFYNAESGESGGANFAIWRYNNNGTGIGQSLSINRESGNWNIDGSVITTGSTTSNHFKTKYESINEGVALYQLNNQEDRIRWGIGFYSAESGESGGANFAIWRYNNNGSGIGQSLSINRETGDWNIDGNVTITKNVGIGMGAMPQYALAVGGKIIAEEIIVKLRVNGTFPDYVFSSNYKLRTLAEVEAFIAENGHLPEVPSAKEVEENGLGIGDMNITLLKKVEELTLYVIELNKRTQALELENVLLKAKQ